MDRTLATLDYETTPLADGKAPRTKFVGFYDGTDYRRVTTPELLKYLRTTKRRFLILHHGKFDVLQLFQDNAPIGILRSHGSRIIRCGLYKHTLQNTVSILPMPLKDIFKAFGVKKLGLDNLRARNYSDCVDYYRVILELDRLALQHCGVSLIRCGTLARTGMEAALLVAGAMPTDSRWPLAYRGGRTEIIRQGTFDLDKYDINSSYPFSILDAPPMAKLLNVWVKSSDTIGALADANVTERLLFPSGTFESYVYQDVLERYLSAADMRVKVISSIDVDLSWLVALKPFVTRLYDLKQATTNKAVRLLAKLILNAFYGRIGLRGEREIVIRASKLPAADELTYFQTKRGFVAFKKVAGSSKHNLPLASYITDNARGRLYAAFKANDTYYGDTDSVFVRAGSDFTGSIGKACGQWKAEGQARVELIANKHYIELDAIGRRYKTTRKGGKGGYVWTLKRFLQQGTVLAQTRESRTITHKRVFDRGGCSKPLVRKV